MPLARIPRYGMRSPPSGRDLDDHRAVAGELELGVVIPSVSRGRGAPRRTAASRDRPAAGRPRHDVAHFLEVGRVADLLAGHDIGWMSPPWIAESTLISGPATYCSPARPRRTPGPGDRAVAGELEPRGELGGRVDADHAQAAAHRRGFSTTGYPPHRRSRRPGRGRPPGPNAAAARYPRQRLPGQVLVPAAQHHIRSPRAGRARRPPWRPAGSWPRPAQDAPHALAGSQVPGRRAQRRRVVVSSMSSTVQPSRYPRGQPGSAPQSRWTR